MGISLIISAVRTDSAPFYVHNYHAGSCDNRKARPIAHLRRLPPPRRPPPFCPFNGMTYECTDDARLKTPPPGNNFSPYASLVTIGDSSNLQMRTDQDQA